MAVGLGVAVDVEVGVAEGVGVAVGDEVAVGVLPGHVVPTAMNALLVISGL